MSLLRRTMLLTTILFPLFLLLTGRGAVFAAELEEWTFELGGPAVSKPLLYEPPGEMGRGEAKGSSVSPEHVVALVLVGSNDGGLYALHQGNGTLLWQRSFGSRLQARPVLTQLKRKGRGNRNGGGDGGGDGGDWKEHEDVLLLAAERGDVYALDPLSGAVRFQLDLGAALTRARNEEKAGGGGGGGGGEGEHSKGSKFVRLVAPPAVLPVSDGAAVFAYFGSNDRIFVVDVGSGTVDAIIRVDEENAGNVTGVDSDADDDEDEDGGESEEGKESKRKRRALKKKMREREARRNPVAPNIEIHAEMLLTPPSSDDGGGGRGRGGGGEGGREGRGKHDEDADSAVASSHRRMLLVGTIKTGLHAFSLDDRVPTALWPLWNYRAAGMLDFQSSPYYDGERDLVLVGGYTGKLHALRGASGAPLWTFDAPSDVVATAAADPADPTGATVVVGSSDLHVYVLSIADGDGGRGGSYRELWRDRFGFAVQGAPQFFPPREGGGGGGGFVVTGTTPRKGVQRPGRQEDGTAPRVAAYRRDFPTYARAWDVATPGMVFGAAAVGTPGGANACRVFFAASDKTVRKAGKCPAEQHHDEL
jgi:outer membrane protein assembly factor BamB